MAKLFYVIGPSGAGKDSVLDYARQHATASLPASFAHRYITRVAESGNENHVALAEHEFNARLDRGFFAMNWGSHGLQYGIGIEINYWLEKGIHVVVNGSRGYLEEAAKKYPEICPVLIDVPIGILHERLLDRGRENSRQIKERIERANSFAAISHQRLVKLDNSGPLQQAGNRFLHLLTNSVCG